jgi:peptide chain release factor 1
VLFRSLTEHRIGVTLYNLDRVMEGDIADLIASIEAADTQQRLEQSAAE